MKGAAYYLRISGALLVICMTVALLLSAVNIATRDVIAANEQREKEAAVAALYPVFSSMEELTDSYPAGVHTVFAVRDGEALLGYAVNVEARGFGGAIQMMVGVDATGAVCGVRVLSHSETPGLGTRALTGDYLATYLGLAEEPVLGENIDGISGATFSSRGVRDGVALALSLGLGGDGV